jgi:hypothetical protein
MNMYSVTYKNILKTGKSLEDFERCLKACWAVQRTWGARTMHFWAEEEGDTHIVFCEYLVQDVRLWNRQAMEWAASACIRSLAETVETRRITVSRIAGPGSGERSNG